MQDFNYTLDDVQAIEREARRLRAVALKSGVSRFVSWVKARFSTHPTGAHHAT